MDDQQLEQLRDIIKQNATIDARNIKNLLDFMTSMIQAKDVNLSNMVNYSKRLGVINEESVYKNYQRLVHNCSITEEELAKIITHVFGMSNYKHVLSMDRTNWRFGEKDINILMLSIYKNGTTIPILWTELDTQGCSDTEERKQLIDKFITIFGKDRIAYLLADREFVGNDWFDYLFKEAINFVIRVKRNTYVEYAGQNIRLDKLFHNLHYDQQNNRKASLNGKQVYLQATMSKENELVIVVSNNKNNQDLLCIYALRWGIECMFKCLKSQGFNFENTHFTKKERIRNLMKLLAIGFSICYLLGLIINSIKKILIKKHGYKLKSYFTVGLNHVIRLLNNALNRFYEILNIILDGSVNNKWKQITELVG